MTTGNGHDAEQNMALAEKATDPAALARRSVQARTEPIESLSPFVFYIATAQDEAPGWWTPSRDLYLRKVWRTEPMLAGAIYSVESKLKTLGWTLDGPHRQVRRYQEMLSESEFGQGWGDLVSKVVEDLLTMDRGAFIEVLRATDGPEGAVLGLAHLDASRCLPTGDLQVPVVYVGDPYGNHRGGDGKKSFYEGLRDDSEKLTGGANVIYVKAPTSIEVPGITTKDTRNHLRRKVALNKILGKLDFNDTKGAASVLTALKESKYPARKEGRTYSSEILEPAHDKYSHRRTAMEFFAVNVEPLQGSGGGMQRAVPPIRRTMGGRTRR